MQFLGEHIDYCGYGVLPMAIEQDIVIAVAPNHEGKLMLCNMDTKFKYVLPLVCIFICQTDVSMYR